VARRSPLAFGVKRAEEQTTPPCRLGHFTAQQGEGPGKKIEDAGLQSVKTTQAERGRPDWPMLMPTGCNARTAASGAHPPSCC